MLPTSLELRVLSLAVVLAAPASAQITLWERALSPPTRAFANFVDDGAGGVLMNGTIYASGFVPVAREVVHYGPDGDVAWTLTAPPGATYDDAYRVWVDPSGDVLVFAVASGSTFELQKRSGLDGSLLWTRSIAQPGASSAAAPRVVFDPSGAFELLLAYGVAGQNRSTVVACDGAGNVLWDTFATAWTTSAPAFDRFVRDPQGNVYYEERFANGLRLAQVSAAGQVTWTHAPVDPRGPIEGSRGLVADPQGGVHWYLALPNSVNPPATFDLRLDAAGTVLGSTDVAGYVRPDGWDSTATHVILGWTNVATGDPTLVVRDAAGVEVWRQLLDSSPFFAALPAPKLDLLGGAFVPVFWSPLVPNVFPFLERLRFDPSGHALWYTGAGPTGTPIAADGTVATLLTGSQLFDVAKQGVPTLGFCFGDGVLTPCPCSNASPRSARAGCLTSQGVGATLTTAGSTSLASNALALDVNSATGTSALIFQGSAAESGGRGAPFGDGLLCVGGSLVRIATRALAAGGSHYPQAGDTAIATRGGVLAPGTRTYQAIFRNAASFCTPSTLNTTNGVFVHWSL